MSIKFHGMEYIRQAYHVPAKRGGRVTFAGKVKGTITGTTDGRLRIRMDGDKYSHVYHPTWELQYDDGPYDAMEVFQP